MSPNNADVRKVLREHVPAVEARRRAELRSRGSAEPSVAERWVELYSGGACGCDSAGGGDGAATVPAAARLSEMRLRQCRRRRRRRDSAGGG